MFNRAEQIRLMEKAEAEQWEEAFPLGNGSLGAMFFGRTEEERIALNEDTLWSGYPMDDFSGEGPGSLERIKQLIREKKYAQADAEASRGFACYASQAYMPLGDLNIKFYGCGEKARRYIRELDMSKAVASCRYYKGDVKYESKAFVSFPDKTVVYRISTKSTDGTIKKTINGDISFSCSLLSKSYTQDKALYLEGECPVTSSQNIERSDRTQLYYDEPEKRGIRFTAIASFVTDGNLINKFNAFSVANASYLEIRINVKTSFCGYDKHPYLEGCDTKKECFQLYLAQNQSSFDQLLSAHVKDHSRYFSRCKIDLGSDGCSAIPVSKRLERYQRGEKDKALPALLFNFGRYLTIAASRKGSQAMNLQGIWNCHFMPPWHSNYTVNINTEMNYFPTLAIGLEEMYQPLLRLIEEVSLAGAITAEKLYGAPGWCCHHNTDIWRHTETVKGQACWLFWNACGGWLCHHLMEYYEYTLDRAFLRKKALPIMEGAVRFYISQLETLDNGYRAVFPATSPENKYVCEDGIAAISETTEMTMAIVRELFENYKRICRILNVKGEIYEKVCEEIPSLMPLTLGSDGRVLEWYGEHTEHEVRHRHVSHLYSLHPGNAVTPEKTPELCRACRKTLEVRGDDGTGWSLAWKSNFYARLWDGEHAFKLIKLQLRLQSSSGGTSMHGGGSYSNLFCAHPPFQIDGNFGALSGMAEMLVQSDLCTLHVIPAIPSEWSDISVKGIRAKGRRRVDIRLKNGELEYLKIYGSLPERITVKGKTCDLRFTEKNGAYIYVK